MKKACSIVALLFLGLFLGSGLTVQAQTNELMQDTENTYKGRVVEILDEKRVYLLGSNISSLRQSLSIEIISNDARNGDIVTAANDYIPLEKGDTLYMKHVIRAEDKQEFYSVSEPDRMPYLIFFTVLFVGAVLAFGGIQGIRGLISLVGSLLLILYVLLPGILGGYSPLLLTVVVASLIVVLGSYITHGFNKTTSSAVIGMVVTVIGTGALAYYSVYAAKLTGFASHEAVYLNFSTSGTIDFAGLLLSGIMIGLLGVLYDVAIGQAVSVEELYAVAPHIGRKKIYARAVRIGREHIGALVNTLAIAYVGASLPLLLYFYASQLPVVSTINMEVFATEIVRTMIGSLGLVLAVPVTTFVAVLMLVKKHEHDVTDNVIKREQQALEKHEHSHGHSH